jgi:hypothetical protein
MNKLTKVGFSALCGSLAAISSANAGEMTVTGGVDMTWISTQNDSTGNPIGMGSNLTFSGSGELANGWTFGVTVANLNGNAYSSTAVNLDMGALGKLNFNQGDSGNGIDAFDDVMPTAWEEPWGAGLSTGIVLVSGSGPSNNVQYTTPTILGTTITLASAPDVGSTDTADKGSSGVEGAKGRGYDATININPSLGTEILSGLNLFVGGHMTDVMDNGTYEGNIYEGVAGITYSLGPVSIGGGRQGKITGEQTATTGSSHYRNNQYGIAFNVNDSLSVSYGYHESTQVDVQRKTGDGRGNKTVVDSFQVAYTMGGASIRLAEIEGSNLSYANANNKEATVVSVALAF